MNKRHCPHLESLSELPWHSKINDEVRTPSIMEPVAPIYPSKDEVLFAISQSNKKKDIRLKRLEAINPNSPLTNQIEYIDFPFDSKSDIPPLLTYILFIRDWYVGAIVNGYGRVYSLKAEIFKVFESGYTDTEIKIWRDFNVLPRDINRIRYRVSNGSSKTGGQNSSIGWG